MESYYLKIVSALYRRKSIEQVSAIFLSEDVHAGLEKELRKWRGNRVTENGDPEPIRSILILGIPVKSGDYPTGHIGFKSSRRTENSISKAQPI